MTDRRSVPPRARRALLPTAALLLGLALAQQPLTPPTYAFGALTPLRLDRAVDGRLEPGDGQNFRDASYLDLYRVVGAAGETLLIEMTSSDVDSYLVLYDLAGNQVASNDDGAGRVGGDSLLETVLPADGDYLLVATSYFGGSGAYTVTRLSPGARFEGAIDVAFGTSERELGAGETQMLRFTLDARTPIRATLASDAFDTVLTIYDEEGVEVAYNDDSEGTDSEVLATLEAGGYYLAVEEFFGGSGGPYTLELVRLQQLD